jgi:hypothetical protein
VVKKKTKKTATKSNLGSVPGPKVIPETVDKLFTPGASTLRERVAIRAGRVPRCAECEARGRKGGL